MVIQKGKEESKFTGQKLAGQYAPALVLAVATGHSRWRTAAYRCHCLKY